MCASILTISGMWVELNWTDWSCNRAAMCILVWVVVYLVLLLVAALFGRGKTGISALISWVNASLTARIATVVMKLLSGEDTLLLVVF